MCIHVPFLRFSCGILHLSLQKIELPSASQLVLFFVFCASRILLHCEAVQVWKNSSFFGGNCWRLCSDSPTCTGQVPLRVNSSDSMGPCMKTLYWSEMCEWDLMRGIRKASQAPVHSHSPSTCKTDKGMIKAALATWGPPALPRPKMRSWTLPAGITMLGHRKGQKFGWRKRDCTDCTDCTCCCDDVLCSACPAFFHACCTVFLTQSYTLYVLYYYILLLLYMFYTLKCRLHFLMCSWQQTISLHLFALMIRSKEVWKLARDEVSGCYSAGSEKYLHIAIFLG